MRMCLCVRACARVHTYTYTRGIQYYGYIINVVVVEVLMYTLLLILYSAVCSPLSVRYGAIIIMFKHLQAKGLFISLLPFNIPPVSHLLFIAWRTREKRVRRVNKITGFASINVGVMQYSFRSHGATVPRMAKRSFCYKTCDCWTLKYQLAISRLLAKYTDKQLWNVKDIHKSVRWQC